VLRGDSYNAARVRVLTRAAVTMRKCVAVMPLRTRLPDDAVSYPRFSVNYGMSGHFSLTILSIGSCRVPMVNASLVARLKRFPGARK
jgi:hypothetical protein